jgi:ParB family chromosome partitioning protein
MPEGELKNIPISDILVLENIRSRLDLDDLTSLMMSLKQNGLLQPVGVYKKRDSNKYILNWGHRRFEAANKLGWKTIPAMVSNIELSEDEFLILNAIENLQRKDNSPVEFGRICARLKEDFNLSVSEIAARLSVPKGKVTRAIEIYSKVPKELQHIIGYRIGGAIPTGKVSATTANEILRLHLTQEVTTNLFNEARRNELGVKDIRLIGIMIQSGSSLQDALEEHQKYKLKTAFLAVNKKKWKSIEDSQDITFTDFLRKLVKGYDRGLVK